jgi:hypothetical protein
MIKRRLIRVSSSEALRKYNAVLSEKLNEWNPAYELNGEHIVLANQFLEQH